MTQRQSSWAIRIGKGLLPLGIIGVCIAAMWPTLSQQDLKLIIDHWHDVSGLQWVLAFGFTVVSFAAVSQYDVIAHRHFNTGAPERAVRRTGVVAVALAQSLGAGLLTGTFVRWRLWPDLGLVNAGKITGVVTGLFVMSMIFMTSIACLIGQTPAGTLIPALACASLVALGVCILSVLPDFRLFHHQIALPGLRAIWASFGWAGIDMMAASLALYMLIPTEHAPALAAFLPIMFLAITAGILSGTPGGLGPFEIVLVTFSAAGSTAAIELGALIVAIAGFRLCYYLIPATLAGTYLALKKATPIIEKQFLSQRLDQLSRAESQVVRQNGGATCQFGTTQAAVWKTRQSYVAMFDPARTPSQNDFKAFQQDAGRQNRFASLYKCTSKTAVAAQNAGWHLIRVAQDAVVDLRTFDVSSSKSSRLRRKLRRAERAGIVVRRTNDADIDSLSRIDAAWQKRVGAARGGTMGRFCPKYLKGQHVLIAEQNGKPIAFSSFHQNEHEWTLDLMREVSNVPDGTMYIMIMHALETARGEGVRFFCLAAIPCLPQTNWSALNWLRTKALKVSHGAGLFQFKSAFTPQWRPLYVAAPSRLGLVISLFDIARSVIYPAPPNSIAPSFESIFHENDENYEIDSNKAA
ncbi:MAG: phosphatidylglycerol lysyltransferase domain-containing protein [Paracoccaceae bacterium]